MKLIEALEKMPAPWDGAINQSGAHTLVVRRKGSNETSKLELWVNQTQNPTTDKNPVLAGILDGAAKLEEVLTRSRGARLTFPDANLEEHRYSIEGYSPDAWEPTLIQPTDPNGKPIHAEMVR